MQGRSLPFRVATLVTGLLECLGFAGVLFGWTSLVFVFKEQRYFEELCEPDAGPLGNATGLDGKGAGPSLSLDSDSSPAPPPARLFEVRKRGHQPPPPSTWIYELPGEGGARSQGVISGCHGSARPRGNFPAPPAGCPRWKRLPWTEARPGACLAGRLGWVGGWPVHPGLLRCARLSSRLQGPGRAVLTHLHPGLLHEQLHDLPHRLHL